MGRSMTHISSRSATTPFFQFFSFSHPRRKVNAFRRMRLVPIVFAHTIRYSPRKRFTRCWQLDGWRPQSSAKTSNVSVELDGFAIAHHYPIKPRVLHSHSLVGDTGSCSTCARLSHLQA